MKSMSIDIETYSDADLGRCGVYRYCESPAFEILLFGYAVDGGEANVVDLARGEQIPEEILDALTDDAVTKWAHNSAFERVCLSRYLRDKGKSLDPFHDAHSLSEKRAQFLNPSSWRCSMVWCAYLGLPLSLKDAGAVLKLTEQKMDEGKNLIRYFSVPCAPSKANGGRTRNLPEHDIQKWETFKAYNRRDVEAEMAIQRKLSRFPVPESVWDEYALDQEINDRGVRVDMELVEKAIAMDARSREELTAVMKQITSLENPNSVSQMKKWLLEKGLELESLGKKDVASALESAPDGLREALELRLQLARSSVKKYQAMKNCACSDGRCRGMFQFYGASRTGRWAGRLVQLQNLARNSLPDLDAARELVKSGDCGTVKMLYGDVPGTLSQLVRTAFIPSEGKKFFVADFSAIEARVIAWYAGEQWKTDAFERGEDIYCETASRMFRKPVEKHGVNGELRQKGKIAELACIAEGEKVLTSRGLVPIERVGPDDLLWDGESWVRHGGVVYRGEREVMSYEGLTATPDHPMWIEGQQEPVQLGVAAARGAHLVLSGDARKPVRLGENHQRRKTLERKLEPLLRAHRVPRVRFRPVDAAGQSAVGEIKRLPAPLKAEADSEMAGPAADRREAEMRKPERPGLPQLRGARDTFRFPERYGRRAVFAENARTSSKVIGNRPYRQQRELCPRQYPLCHEEAEQHKPAHDCTVGIQAGILALFPHRGYPEAVRRRNKGRNHLRRRAGSLGEKKALEAHLRTARVYDIRNAGKYHRFTVSGKLVHNCGYGGSAGALKAMGALEMGLTENELSSLVSAWRAANPRIVQFWRDVDRAAKRAVKLRESSDVHGVKFSYKSGFLFITLPSGRSLAYAKPRIGENRFGGECVTYEGTGAARKRERLETYGPKLVENIVQATARDILCHAMRTLRCCSIVMHVHDEIVIEAEESVSLEELCSQTGRTPPWAPGLKLRADGFICGFYRKD